MAYFREGAVELRTRRDVNVTYVLDHIAFDDAGIQVVVFWSIG